MASRYLHKRITINSMNLSSHIDQIIRVIRKNGINFVIAIGEAQMVALNEFRDEIEKYARLLFPPKKKLEKVLDKWATIKIAKRIGVPVPESIIIKERSDIKICKDIAYPVVVKPSRRHLGAGFNPKHDFRVKYFTCFEKLEGFLIYALEVGNIPLVQEELLGEESCIGFLRYGGDIKACCQFNFLRMSEVQGIPTSKEVVKPSPDLFDHGKRILAEIGWEGVALLDFMICSKDNSHKLLEINGRFWGSTTVCVRAGIDFPYLLYLTVGKGMEIQSVEAKVPTRVRNLGGDTKRLWRILKNPKANNKSTLPNIMDYFSPFFHRRQHEVQIINDPLPGVVDIIIGFLRILGF